MPVYAVIRKSDQAEVTRYSAVQATVFGEYSLDLYDHTEVSPEAPSSAPVRPEDWYIGVGPFWDRFGVSKLPILASQDALVQAIIKDSSVPKNCRLGNPVRES